MHVLIIYKFDENQIKNKQVLDRKTLILVFMGEQMNNPIWPKYKLIQDFLHVLLICKLEEDQIKNKQVIDQTTFILAFKGE